MLCGVRTYKFKHTERADPDWVNTSLVVEFYPSISENLLNRALDFASLSTNVTDEERMIILHAGKSLLFDKDRDWVKNSKNVI